MFKRTSEPLPLSEASLLALRPALNAPVLNVSFLPVGPARAALVAFAEEWGGIGLALGIRSNESGQVAVFRNRETIQPEVSIAAALEPVLAQAERMGFLFDEDMVEHGPGEDPRGDAMALWGRLMGEIETPVPRAVEPEPAATEPIVDLSESAAPSGASSAAEPAPEPDRSAPGADRSAAEPVAELVLDDIAGFGPEADAEGDLEFDLPEIMLAPEDEQSGVEPASPSLPPQRPATPAEPPQARLSKFRSADAGDGGGPDGGSRLGRIPIVRVRRGRDGATRVPFLARLLSSF